MADAQPRDGTGAVKLPEHVQEMLGVLAAGKGENLVALDMRGIAGFTDYMILCSGRSDTHVRALVDALDKHRRKQGAKAAHIEGRREGAWILLDFFDVIVHVFTLESREFYQLERLWRDAPLVEWQGDASQPA